MKSEARREIIKCELLLLLQVVIHTFFGGHLVDNVKEDFTFKTRLKWFKVAITMA